jgi:hypothetical protein
MKDWLGDLLGALCLFGSAWLWLIIAWAIS